MRPWQTASTIVYRLKADYLIGSRMREYDAFLRSAREQGYTLLSLTELYDTLKNQSGSRDFRCVALRHDVDVRNVKGTERFHLIELEHGTHATYYFRLSTAKLHGRLIRQLLNEGFEVGYHFEEAAKLAKRRHLRTRGEVFGCRSEIAEMFRRNCRLFRDLYNPQLRSVCSHGDWINCRLNFQNHELIDDNLLAGCGLSFEAYQRSFLSLFDVYISDIADAPAVWKNDYSPFDALAAQKRRICLLTHERYWYPGPVVNTVENLARVWEGLRYQLAL